ncbi:MAG TPA: DNA replication and repair protein RecF [Solirubrobacteraceae bacterium]|jgi:DNA replication and repair protein RecF|nr:DNA replication and repair protein RecF [Solirubrobacteraceae bacterium]
MPVTTVSLRNFRSYEVATAHLDEDLTVLTGPNGAGKTNLLEGLYYGCTGRSCRTTNDREVVKFGASATRVVVSFDSDSGSHEIAVGFVPGEAKRMTLDGANIERLVDSSVRPLVSVFLPDRLGLIKGAPALRRSHLDQLVMALWPARSGTRRAYSETLAQRNALLLRVRAGHARRSSLSAWDAQLAEHALALMDARRGAVERTAREFSRMCGLLGLDGDPALVYRPRSRAADHSSYLLELQQRVDGDLERGFTGHGPHRDEMSITCLGRELRTYGSQGQQRLALLALLMAEREVIAALRGTPPVLLLDDVMSELDGSRRAALVGLLRDQPGQALITTTDLDQLPGSVRSSISRLGVAGGGLLQAVSEAA